MTNYDKEPKHKSRGHRDISKSFATLHGWSLTFLYFSLVVWSAMISYALLRFGMLKLTSGAFMPWLVLLGCIVTFVTSAQAGKQFWQAMRQKQSLPPIALIPFMAIAVTIAMAGTAFNSL